jgi:hypothetical protein
MGGIGSGGPGNPGIKELGQATRFKPGADPRRSSGKGQLLGKRRKRRLMRESLPAVAALEMLGGDLESLRTLVAAQCYRRLTGDKTQSETEWEVAAKLLGYLFAPLATSPPPAPRQLTADEALAAIRLMHQRPEGEDAA